MLVGHPVGLGVAVLGWGSLLWDPRELRVATAWDLTDFTLPLEFSRVSSGNRLTLVIDPKDGRECPVYFALSSFREPDDARANLTTCERAEQYPDNIAVVMRQDPPSADQYRERIRSWTIRRGLDATTWSAFKPNFAQKSKSVLGTPTAFSLPDARHYLAQLKATDPAQFAEARRYIANAAALVRTPLRVDLDENGWP